MNCFELTSGLKVNFLKSRIGGMGVDQIISFAAILKCEVIFLLSIWGCLWGCHKRGAFWVGVVDRIKNRLGRWRGRFLSMAGRICLIKYVLSSIPLFYVSLYKMSSSVLKEIVKLQRDFLWGWGSEGRKIYWAYWKKVCEPREAGGLGILDIRLFNVAMWGKWIWCLSFDKDGLWKEVL